MVNILYPPPQNVNRFYKKKICGGRNVVYFYYSTFWQALQEGRDKVQNEECRVQGYKSLVGDDVLDILKTSDYKGGRPMVALSSL